MKKTRWINYLAAITMILLAASAFAAGPQGDTRELEMANKRLEAQNQPVSQLEGTEATVPFSGDNTSGPTWDRPYTLGTGTSGSCSISSQGPVNYEVQPFFVDITGLYTIYAAWTGYDGYLHLYENAFNPLDQCVDLIALDDDGPGGTSDSEIVDVTLTAGLQYYLIASGYSAGAFGPYSGTIDGVGTATLGTVPVELQSFTIE